MNKDDKIFVAGHRGLVGSALVRQLRARGYYNLLLFNHSNCDLTNRNSVHQLFSTQRPEYVFLAAARVGGVCSNDHREADFLLQNLQIQNNVIECAQLFGVKKLLFLGSACVYPRLAPEPVVESDLLCGPLEPSNQWYAIAKIAGIKLCQAMRRQHGCDFISAMPTNLYGPNDNYDLQTSHVLPALIRKFHEAKISDAPSVTCWGTGAPFREFLYADDLAKACVFLMRNYSDEQFINAGSGEELTIRELAESIADVTGFRGAIVWDHGKPDGTPRKLMDSSRLRSLG